MLTGEIRSQINSIWDSFWSGGLTELDALFASLQHRAFRGEL